MLSKRALAFAITLALSSFACGDDASSNEDDGGGDATGGSGGTAVERSDLVVSGMVVDFQTGTAVEGSATVSTAGLTPPPTVSVTGAQFEITGIAPFSVFHLLSGAPPGYRSTYGLATTVEDTDVDGIQAAVVAETMLADMQSAFDVSPAPGTGIVIGRAVDGAGQPKAGVPAGAFAIDGATPPRAPVFLDGARQPAPGLTSTSESGYVVLYDVPAGLATIGSADGSSMSITGASAPVAAMAVTLVDLTVGGEDVALPTNVSFVDDVLPIFIKRGCEVCHSGSSPGADLGSLTLNGSANLIYKELTTEISPTHKTLRVDLEEPAKSLLLTMPSAENPADSHPNATFPGTSDPDYLTLLGWITEGAAQD